MSGDQPIDDHEHGALERLLSGLRGHLEPDLRAHVDDRVRAATAERDRVAAIAAEAARQQAQAQLGLLRDAARKQNEDLRTSAESQITELRRLLDDLRRSAEQQIDATRETLETEVAAVRERADLDIEDARRVAQEQVEDVQRAQDERLAQLRRELDEAHAQVATAQHQLDGATEEARASAERAAAAQNVVAAHEQQVATAADAAHRQASDAHAAQVRQLADVVRSLDAAQSLGDVLDRLARFAARDVERSMLLMVKGHRLVEWRKAGFGTTTADTAPVDIPLDDAHFLGVAVREGRVAVSGGVDGAALPAFAATNGRHDAAALPITVGGAVVAVLYADAPASDMQSDGRWPPMLEVMVSHASRVLEAMTIRQATGLWMPPQPPAAARAVPVSLPTAGVQ